MLDRKQVFRRARIPCRPGKVRAEIAGLPAPKVREGKRPVIRLFKAFPGPTAPDPAEKGRRWSRWDGGPGLILARRKNVGIQSENGEAGEGLVFTFADIDEGVGASAAQTQNAALSQARRRCADKPVAQVYP